MKIKAILRMLWLITVQHENLAEDDAQTGKEVKFRTEAEKKNRFTQSDCLRGKLTCGKKKGRERMEKWWWVHWETALLEHG